jgi:hypothetical protein
MKMVKIFTIIGYITCTIFLASILAVFFQIVAKKISFATVGYFNFLVSGSLMFFYDKIPPKKLSIICLIYILLIGCLLIIKEMHEDTEKNNSEKGETDD